jgi:hypothetical protein
VFCLPHFKFLNHSCKPLAQDGALRDSFLANLTDDNSIQISSLFQGEELRSWEFVLEHYSLSLSCLVVPLQHR